MFNIGIEGLGFRVEGLGFRVKGMQGLHESRLHNRICDTWWSIPRTVRASLHPVRVPKMYEPLSKLLVSPLISPIVVPYIIPYITPPFKEFRL